METYLALDIGGTEIKSALLDKESRQISDITRSPANSAGSSDEILSGLADIICKHYDICIKSGYELSGIGLAFPGPFDYAKGISLISGIGKYDSIFGMNLKSELTRLTGRDILMLFANDADLFCLGECFLGEGRGSGRVMLVCIGTGIGSGFISEGRLIKSGPLVPECGWIYNTKYRDGILDGWLSATGIRRMIKESGKFENGTDVKELAGLALRGNKYAIEIFEQFGQMLADVLPGFAERFGAELLIVGGQVSRSAKLFTAPLKERLKGSGIQLRISPDSALSAMKAIPLLFQNQAIYPY